MKIANACKYLILNQSKLSRKQAPKKKKKVVVVKPFNRRKKRTTNAASSPLIKHLEREKNKKTTTTKWKKVWIDKENYNCTSTRTTSFTYHLNNINIFFVSTDCSDKESFLWKHWTVLCLWCPFFLVRTFPMSVSLWLLKSLFCSNTELFCVRGVGSFAEDISHVCVPLLIKESVLFKHWIVSGLLERTFPTLKHSHCLPKNLFCWNVHLFCVRGVWSFSGGHFPFFSVPILIKESFSMKHWIVLWHLMSSSSAEGISLVFFPMLSYDGVKDISQSPPERRLAWWRCTYGGGWAESARGWVPGLPLPVPGSSVTHTRLRITVALSQLRNYICA